jgi:diaminopimelate epimerase
MELHFTKMHGAGNDFIVINAITQDVSKFQTEHWRQLADRRFGIGADQILLVEKSNLSDADFKYRILNSDGSEVEQCGNGSRCFVRFVRLHGLTNKTEIKVEVGRSIITLTELPDLRVTVNMGAPILNSSQIPFSPNQLDQKNSGDAELFKLPLDNRPPVWIHAVSMGNPHAVQIVQSVLDAPVTVDGPLIENHPAFPNKVNAGFVEIINEHLITIRVFERGSGETLSCGTGACAAVVSCILQKLVQSPVKVQTRGGNLDISWDYLNQGLIAPVMMTGPATFVFEGKIHI